MAEVKRSWSSKRDWFRAVKERAEDDVRVRGGWCALLPLFDDDVVGALNINNISIVAHSQGCLTALEFVSRYPDKVRSVSFVASGLATPVNAALIDAAENDPTRRRPW